MGMVATSAHHSGRRKSAISPRRINRIQKIFFSTKSFYSHVAWISRDCDALLVRWAGVDARPYTGNVRPTRECYSNASGCKPMFFSPAAFFSLYFFIQASQVLPAAVSLPVKASAAMSA